MSYRLTGKVKWFLEEHGLGIIISDESGEEVLVQQSSIKSDGRRSLVAGETVEFGIQHGNYGWINAVEVTVPNGANVQGSLRESFGGGRPRDGGYESRGRGGGGAYKMSSRLKGKVKWFLEEHGLGIIISDESGEEVLVQQSSIKSDGRRRLVAGETVEFGIQHGNYGWINAVEVTVPNGANVQGSLRESFGGGRPRDGGYGSRGRGGGGAYKMSSRLKGKVKWFLEEHGLGIIISDESGEEVLVQQSSIKSDGRRRLVAGETVEFGIQHGNYGWINAVEVTVPNGANVQESLRESFGGGRPRDGRYGSGGRGGSGAYKMSSRLTGKVKWFLEEHGLGIIISDESGEEVLVQQSSIKSDGRRSLVAGETVEFGIQHGNYGWINAVEVTVPNGANVQESLRESFGGGRPHDGRYGSGGRGGSGAYKMSSRLTGKVKWFLEEDGLGIIISDESGEEVLVQQSSIKSDGRRSLVAGETVEFGIQHGNYGWINAVEVTVPNGANVQESLRESFGGGRPRDGRYGSGGRGGSGAYKMSSRLTGKVKWFLEEDGLGIIISDDSGEEVLVQQSSIKSDGRRTLVAGETVEFGIQHGNYGWINAVEVTVPNGANVQESLRESFGGGRPRDGRYGSGGRGGSGAYKMSSRLTGKVKWFLEEDGLGIIISDESGEEVLVQQSSIKSDGRRSLVAGETVEFGIQHGNYGWINAVEVTVPSGANVQESLRESFGGGRPRDGRYGSGGRGGSGAYKMSSRLTGKVKWFLEEDGLGIIISDESGEEVLVQQSSIKSDGRRSLVAGEMVEFGIQHGNYGWINAVEVTVLNGANVQGSLRESCGGGCHRDGGYGYSGGGGGYGGGYRDYAEGGGGGRYGGGGCRWGRSEGGYGDGRGAEGYGGRYFEYKNQTAGKRTLKGIINQ